MLVGNLARGSQLLSETPYNDIASNLTDIRNTSFDSPVLNNNLHYTQNNSLSQQPQITTPQNQYFQIFQNQHQNKLPYQQINQNYKTERYDYYIIFTK